MQIDPDSSFQSQRQSSPSHASPSIDGNQAEGYFFCTESNIPYYDCILEARHDVKLYCNRTVLTLHSMVFRDLLQTEQEKTAHLGGKGISGPTKIPVHSHTHEDINLMLCTLYFTSLSKNSNTYGLSEDTCLRLLTLADKFDMPHILRLCEDYLCCTSFVNSAAFQNSITKWTLLAEKLNLQRLWNYCEYTLATMPPKKFLEILSSDDFNQLDKSSIVKIVARNYTNNMQIEQRGLTGSGPPRPSAMAYPAQGPLALLPQPLQ